MGDGPDLTPVTPPFRFKHTLLAEPCLIARMVESNELKAIVCVLVILVGVSAVMPAIVDAVDSEAVQEQTVTQTEGERTTLSGPLYAIPEDIRVSPDPEVNVTLVDTDTDDTVSTGPIGEGNETTVVKQGYNVTVSVLEVVDTNEAVINYEYPLALGLPDGANVILGNVTLLIMLIVVMVIMALLLAAATRGN